MATPENYKPSKEIAPHPTKLVVYYDDACPKCIRDRRQYEKLAGRHGKDVYWFDITGQESRLHEVGIDPQKAS